MFATKRTKRLEVPGETDVWVDIRALSWKELEHARNAGFRESADRAKFMGAELIKAFSTPEGEKKAAKFLKDQEYNPSNFSTEWVLHYAVMGWSLEVSLEGKEGEHRDEVLAQLDASIAAWLKKEALALCKPPDEEEEKKDS